MKKILITGSNGFIGKNLSEGLINDYEIHALKRDNLDLLNTEAVQEYLAKNNFDVVIHTANTNSTRNINTTSYEIIDRNLRMFFNLERSKEYYGKMYYFGSGAEYDMRSYIPNMDEEYFGQNIPQDPYGFSKYIMSQETMKNNNIYDLRLFGVFGKYEEWERRFISNAICRCIYDLPITIKQNVYFDYLYVDDLVNIMKWFIENTPQNKHYNVCTSDKISLLELGKKVLQRSGKNLDIIISQPGLKKEYTGCNKRLLKEMKYVNFTSIDSAINNLYEYYLTNKKHINIKKLLI